MNDANIRFWHADLLSIVYNMQGLNGVRNGETQATTIFGEKPKWVALPQTGRYPGTAFAVFSDCAAVFAAGLQTLSHGLAFTEGYTTSRVVNSLVITSPWFADWIGATLPLADGVAKLTNGPVYFVGHSAGGALVQLLRVLLRFRRPTVTMRVVTAGSPRPCYPVPLEKNLGEAFWRWMTPGDPVPNIPLRVEDLGNLSLLFDAETLAVWGRYAHLPGGRVVNSSGSVSFQMTPPVVQVSRSADVVDWIFNEDGVPKQQHNLATYLAYMRHPAKVVDKVRTEGIGQVPLSIVIPAVSEQAVDPAETRAAFRLVQQQAGLIP
jgi:hypothetical protein